MTRQETSVLAAQPFLRGMPPGQLHELAGLCEHVTVPAGQRLTVTAAPWEVQSLGTVTTWLALSAVIAAGARDARRGSCPPGSTVPVRERRNRGLAADPAGLPLGRRRAHAARSVRWQPGPRG